MKGQRTLDCGTQDRAHRHVPLPELRTEDFALGLTSLLRPVLKLESGVLRHFASWEMPEHGQRDRLGPQQRAPAELSGSEQHHCRNQNTKRSRHNLSTESCMASGKAWVVCLTLARSKNSCIVSQHSAEAASHRRYLCELFHGDGSINNKHKGELLPVQIQPHPASTAYQAR
jgi:hypothetical protein